VGAATLVVVLLDPTRPFLAEEEEFTQSAMFDCLVDLMEAAALAQFFPFF